MKVSNKQKEQARNADLISFMQDNYPTRLMQDGKAWRDTKYPDITIWRSSRDGMYKFKAHAVNTQAIKEDNELPRSKLRGIEGCNLYI